MKNRIVGNKRGGIGSFISMFVAIIFIMIILLGFVFISGIWEKISEAPFVGDDTGKENRVTLFNYTDKNYLSLNELRFVVADGLSVDSGIKEVSYG